MKYYFFGFIGIGSHDLFKLRRVVSWFRLYSAFAVTSGYERRSSCGVYSIWSFGFILLFSTCLDEIIEGIVTEYTPADTF
jgi:hypothetical protein